MVFNILDYPKVFEKIMSSEFKFYTWEEFLWNEGFRSAKQEAKTITMDDKEFTMFVLKWS